MAGSIQLKKGTKMQLAFDVPVGQEPQFNMLCTFNKALDESAFLVSAPMVDGKRLVPDESQKLLFKYTEGEESNILAGYVDDVVKEGIRHYLKVRRVAEQRQFIKRMDVRMKVELPITYMQDTWELNSEGEVDKEKGQTMDISNNGLAVYMNRWFEVGESCIFTRPGRRRPRCRSAPPRPRRRRGRACARSVRAVRPGGGAHPRRHRFRPTPHGILRFRAARFARDHVRGLALGRIGWRGG